MRDYYSATYNGMPREGHQLTIDDCTITITRLSPTKHPEDTHLEGVDSDGRTIGGIVYQNGDEGYIVQFKHGAPPGWPCAPRR